MSDMSCTPSGIRKVHVYLLLKQFCRLHRTKLLKIGIIYYGNIFYLKIAEMICKTMSSKTMSIVFIRIIDITLVVPCNKDVIF